MNVTLTHTYIRTYTGKKMEPLNPKPEDIEIMDIAHALANNCRFCGHTKWHYSVAQHSWYVSKMVEEVAPEHALAALLHDASEAYLSDIARPIKHTPEFDRYREIEHRLERVIAERFGLVHPWVPAIKTADNRMLATELRDLMPTDEPLPFEPLRGSIAQWSPRKAKEHFVWRYAELTEDDYGT